jgi:hypothetical protein
MGTGEEGTIGERDCEGLSSLDMQLFGLRSIIPPQAYPLHPSSASCIPGLYSESLSEGGGHPSLLSPELPR